MEKFMGLKKVAYKYKLELSTIIEFLHIFVWKFWKKSNFCVELFGGSENVPT
jgi:hypothetical protein